MRRFQLGTRDLAVDTLAIHRLTRLVTADTITRPLRVRVIAIAYGTDEWKWPNDTVPVGATNALSESDWDALPHGDDDAPKLAAFIVCPWCVGLWISFGVCVLRRYTPGVWEPVARALALSTAAAVIAAHETAG